MKQRVTEDTAGGGTPTADGNVLSMLLIHLLKGVQYQQADAARWDALLALQARVRDYVTVLGLELVLDEAEGHAFLRSRPEPDDPGVNAMPRLIARRPLSFPVSLLLALLRRRLAEFDASGGETRLVLSRAELVEMVRLFLPDSSNEARLIDRIESHLGKIVELGFLRRLPGGSSGAGPAYEVRRILKAFVDAQWLADFDARLAEYQARLGADSGSAPTGVDDGSGSDD